jgi:hypothetical protein
MAETGKTPGVDKLQKKGELTIGGRWETDEKTMMKIRKLPKARRRLS